MNYWLPALIGVGGVVVGWLLSALLQYFMFLQTARKERLAKIRDALVDFGAAAYSYLEAMREDACFAQKYMNMGVTRGQSVPFVDLGLGPTPEELKRQDALLDDRERKAGDALRGSRDRLLTAKARLYVLTDDKQMQASVHEMWDRLLNVNPKADVPRHTNDGTNPHFALIAALRPEVDAWLQATADDIPNLFWSR